MKRKKDEPKTKVSLNEQSSIEEIVVPKGYRLLRESKNEHLQLLVRHTTKDGLKKVAANKGTSVNALANKLFEDYLEKEWI
jgi:hypothetical protein